MGFRASCAQNLIYESWRPDGRRTAGSSGSTIERPRVSKHDNKNIMHPTQLEGIRRPYSKGKSSSTRMPACHVWRAFELLYIRPFFRGRRPEALRGAATKQIIRF
jgi:hypothetical protein